ncbi:helix-turn-helix transcriptional regulator [Agrobacterium vitis]|uniref:Helix-turn-helix domain-containing protein n=2 Tax=Agrobacterium vitis TaxID=373 RepID=A0AAE4W9F1_AGRVI|nr:helix-turn-helix transcriptional regulator [Agrobacterium vitis]MCF1498530.1 helix-turn-helix transcriptional regulator [Allorhizobium sp. Av2]MCM2438352.1 helix-turn-helix transcriptional regulator [Agrobacterium vitis]MUZ56266.1 helix-turn-helix domain-containing protein [Agrobacterium vitis]MVA64597.1 helix-turn-helix domain-containing protein [Agrobacterium vitis]MVA85568.1 helix-turn-helix domain-containing protein [Agrobacterium vitis]
MKSNGRMALGENIRSRRQELEISQERLAEQAGLHRTYVGGVERGERNVSLDNILSIARALNTTASDLMRGVS